MKKILIPLAACLLFVGMGAAPVHRETREWQTVRSSAELVRAFSALAVRGIPPAVLSESAGVAIIPHVVKAGLVLDHRVGHGILLVHEPGGRWSNPVFITLEGNGFGLEAGVESTDLILVFKTPASVERVLSGRGKFKLGADVAVAAGPLGRETRSGAARPTTRRGVFISADSRTVRGLLARRGPPLGRWQGERELLPTSRLPTCRRSGLSSDPGTCRGGCARATHSHVPTATARGSRALSAVSLREFKFFSVTSGRVR